MTASLRRDEIQRHIVGPTAPSSLAAERALIGIVLADPSSLDLIEALNPSHFFEPLHDRIWAAIQDRHAKGGFADPMLLDGHFLNDEAYREAGGIIWLSNLVEVAPGPSKAAPYAEEIKEAAQRRDLLKLSDAIAAQVREGEASASDVIGATEASLLAMQATSRKLELISAGAASAKVLAYLDAPATAVYGIKTGIASLDEQLGPLLPGNLILFMGQSSMGKSAAGGAVGLNISEQGHGVIEINGEMTDEEMAQRHLSDICQAQHSFAGPEYREIRRRNVTTDQRAMLQHAHAHLAGLPLQMIKRAGLKLSQLRSLARRQAAVWARQGIPLGALVIDHAGLLRPDKPSHSRYEDQTLVSNAMKELADELQCVVICLNQMNRQYANREDKRPQLSDLRDSGSWEQDADIIVGWYREQYFAQRMAEPQVTKTGKAGADQHIEWAEWDRARKSRRVEAIILKARSGPCLTVNLWGDVARNAIRSDAPEGALF